MKIVKTRWPQRSALARLSTMALASAGALLIGCSKAPEATTMEPSASVTLGTQVDDTVITGSVKSALLADPDVKSFDLQVQTRKGTVQLSGFVDSQAQIEQALKVARGVSGVTEVENGMSLKGADGTLGGRIDDSAVTGRVKTALLADPDVRSLDISVLTVEGVVQLTGFVNNQAQVDRAAALAVAAEGARSVKNELSIKQ